MNSTTIKKIGAFCYPHHVNTSMKKIVSLLMKTLENLYDKREKNIH
jgi:hypothetical protein